jgi:hypothetical protein
MWKASSGSGALRSVSSSYVGLALYDAIVDGVEVRNIEV